MTEDDDSMVFVDDHIGNSFSSLMNEYIIRDLEWLEMLDGSAHAIARLADPTAENMKCNIICLFPPFVPNR